MNYMIRRDKVVAVDLYKGMSIFRIMQPIISRMIIFVPKYAHERPDYCFFTECTYIPG